MLGIGVFSVLAFAFVTPAHAATDWDVTGTYVFTFTLGGDYPHDVILAQDSSGNVTGGGGHPVSGPPYTYEWTIDTGVVTDDTFVFTAHYTLGAIGTTMYATGTIASDGTMSGVWDDDFGGYREGTWHTTDGEATEINYEIVGENTSAGENLPGWLFNRDVTTATPYEFNEDEASIGDGSLYVKPIGANASDKFIGENFINTPIANVNLISYDFMIGAGGVDTDEEQFYMNVYANFGSSDDLKFYDCRYNVVPTIGSTAGFTTVTFDPTQSYPVTTHSSSPFTCPASPADMDDLSAGSNIRVFALNVGDTSASDEGIDGYLDNVFVSLDTESTQYDFELLDFEAPIVSSVVTPLYPVAGMLTTLTANVDDTTTGDSDITSAEYRITGGAWTPMNASDVDFDEVNEDVTVEFAFETPGIKEVCVRGTDIEGNISTPSGDDCVIVSVIDPLTGYVSGGGNIKEEKKVVTTFGGNAGYVPDVGLVGQLQVVNHVTKVACHYNTINWMTVVGDTATVNATGKCNNGNTPTTTTLMYVDKGEPGTADMFNSKTLAGGNIQVGGETLGVQTFTATDSAYYNGLSVSDGLYGTGPITFTWDIAGNVTGGLWEEIVPPTSGTHYFNIVTGGTVSGDNVTLTLDRTNPSAYGPFTIVGTLIGGVLSGTAAGPYLFTATGTITP